MKIGILLAAGLGKRMRSELPKVLLDLNGEPLATPALRALYSVCDRVVVVVGHRGGDVKKALGDRMQELVGDDGGRLRFVTQEQQRGTGDAVRVAWEAMASSTQNDDEILVCNGDGSLVSPELFERILTQAQANKMQAAFVTQIMPNPKGLGRVLRNSNGRFIKIQEEADANAEEKKTQEVNAGLYYFRADFLNRELSRLKADNAQSEYYLTDLFLAATDQVGPVLIETVGLGGRGLLGVNTPWELAELRELDRMQWLRSIANEHGVEFLDPSSTLISKRCVFQGPAVIGPNVVLKGKCVIGAQVVIEGNCYLENVSVGEASRLRWSVVAAEAVIGRSNKIGPMAHLRPGSVIDDEVSLGNFVETKKTHIHRGAKVNHLSYLGDAEVGEGTNIGCGTITCNYDGFSKHRTVIGKGAFIGSDTQLVAPVEIGDRAYIASGTTVTEDIPEGSLAIARPELVVKAGYADRLAEKMSEKAKGGEKISSKAPSKSSKS